MRRIALTQIAADVVNYLIDERGMTVTEIAAVCGVGKSFISRCKNGEREFGPGHLDAIAEALDVLPGALLIAARPPKIDHPNPKVREIQRLCVELMEQSDRVTQAFRERDASRPASSAA